MRKKNQELKKLLLDCARRIECAEGADALSVRKLASEANIAVGTVYNYFESKQEVMLAMTEEYWNSALMEMQGCITAERFSEQIRQIYAFLTEKLNDCAKVLMMSLREDAQSGRARMVSMQQTVGRALVKRLESDALIRKNIWSDSFTKEAFASFVLDNLFVALRQPREDVDFLVEIIERILYSPNRTGKNVS
jgi:AcrR family transcriptional regulator